MHKGIDIAEGGVHGATVRASDGGVVTIAGDLNDGYGNYVVIDHGNGYKNPLRSRQRHLCYSRPVCF